jgi:enterochelin esterase-like enzyme
MRKYSSLPVAFLILWTLTVGSAADAQTRPVKGPPQFVSPEVLADKRITFRIWAPKADAVRLASSDVPGNGAGVKMSKSEAGLWEATIGPVVAGAYRYAFNVDGLTVIDPKNPATSESNANTWSLVYVSGSTAFDTLQVPHGAVAEVMYFSDTLKTHRRMHIYTPPGYESSAGKYPILYLLHGVMDGDASWGTVGRAGAILDNLIAAGKAKPMIVVMPNGHTGTFRFGGPDDHSFDRQMEEFAADFAHDLKPYVEKNYRVIGNRANRAIAGLSMGGAQTLNIAFADLNEYGSIGVFSSGVFGIAGGFGAAAPGAGWEDRHKSTLDQADLKPGTRLIWFGCGTEDFLLKTSETTVTMLKSHSFDVISKQSAGGHTWLNWRDYLQEFTPLLFKE